MCKVNDVLSERGGHARIAGLLWPKVNIGEESDCWEWRAKSVAHYGYGRFSAGRGRQLRAHRAAWALANGPIPQGMIICHKCDNPKCCNPQHLFLGTKADNTRDMMRKGRHSPPPIKNGENHHNAKFDDSVAELIRESLSIPARILASRHGVSDKTIYRVRRGESRAH